MTIVAPAMQALSAALSATAATADLIQFAQDGDPGPCRSLDEDTIPQLADALKMTIELAGTPDPSDVEGAELLGQLTGALSRFLEGWA